MNDVSRSPTISVVIATRNRRESLGRVLRHLQTTAPAMEIVVVDDGSSPPVSLGIAATTVLRRAGEPSAAAARNVGVRHSSGEIVVLLDDDAFPSSDMWPLLVAVLEGIPAAWVAPQIVRPNGSHSDCVRLLEVQHLRATCLATRRETFEAIGGFDDELPGAILNDYDLCVRAREAGQRLVCVPTVLAVHDDQRRTFREQALRYHDWVALTPKVWARRCERRQLTAWEHGVYATALYPRRRAVRAVAALLRPPHLWNLFVRILPADSPPDRLARALQAIINVRGAQVGLRSLSPDDRLMLAAACRAAVKEEPPSWVIRQLPEEMLLERKSSPTEAREELLG